MSNDDVGMALVEKINTNRFCKFVHLMLTRHNAIVRYLVRRDQELGSTSCKFNAKLKIILTIILILVAVYGNIFKTHN